MPARRRSLSRTLLVTTAALLLAAFTLTIYLLDTVFQRTSEDAIQDLLEAQAFALVGLADTDMFGNLSLPSPLPESRLTSPASGLYAEIVDEEGGRIWRSPSAIGMGLRDGLTVVAGERIYQRRVLDDGTEALVLGIGITWEMIGDVTYGFQLYVGEDLSRYNRQLAKFRQQMLGWFAGVMLTLLLGIWFLLRAGLAPLHKMADEISAIEDGRRETLSQDYPRELFGVARNMNALVRSERQRIARFRTTMDDLAHSLKTPLAVLRTELDGNQPDDDVLRDQVGRMQGVVDYRLRRAAATGPRTLAVRSISVAPGCVEIASSLRKIHRDKNVRCEFHIPDGTSYPIERGDWYELVGNLLDNAWKWCAGNIELSADYEPPSAGDGKTSFIVTVDDDGAGVAEDQLERILSRGERGDQRGDVPGQGIGLAVVAEIVELYGGSIRIERSGLGGARIELRLPVV